MGSVHPKPAACSPTTKSKVFPSHILAQCLTCSKSSVNTYGINQSVISLLCFPRFIPDILILYRRMRTRRNGVGREEKEKQSLFLSLKRKLNIPIIKTHCYSSKIGLFLHLYSPPFCDGQPCAYAFDFVLFLKRFIY